MMEWYLRRILVRELSIESLHNGYGCPVDRHVCEANYFIRRRNDLPL